MPQTAPLAAGVWPKASVRDVAESIGLTNLSDEAASALASDVEFRLHQIVEESVKFMRHAKRTKLKAEDVDNALRVRNIEPLWGFASSDTLAFRRTTSAAGNLYFVEDDEIDLSRIMQAQLPPAQRETSYTAHWLAVEGVQPAIPQNPTLNELQHHPGFASGQAAAASVPGAVTSTVKHHLSRELQLYFDRVTTAAFDDFDKTAREAGLASLSGDPGLHQVVPYLVQFAAEKVTSTLSSPTATASPAATMQTLQCSLDFLEAVLSNPNLFLEPYLQQVLPTILTCLLSTSFSPIPSPSGPPAPLDDEHSIRLHSGSLLASLIQKYGSSYPTLRARVLKTLLRASVEKRTSSAAGASSGAGSRWGAALALKSLGAEASRTLLAANVAAVGEALAADIRAGDSERANKVLIEISDLFVAMAGAHTADLPPLDDLEAAIGPEFAGRLSDMDAADASKAYAFIRSVSEGDGNGANGEASVNGKHGENEDQEMASASPVES